MPERQHLIATFDITGCKPAEIEHLRHCIDSDNPTLVATFVAKAARKTPEELRVIILETLQRQAATTGEGKTLVRRAELAEHVPLYIRGDDLDERSASALMDGLMNQCAGNLASIVDMLIDIAQKGE